MRVMIRTAVFILALLAGTAVQAAADMARKVVLNLCPRRRNAAAGVRKSPCKGLSPASGGGKTESARNSVTARNYAACTAVACRSLAALRFAVVRRMLCEVFVHG